MYVCVNCSRFKSSQIKSFLISPKKKKQRGYSLEAPGWGTSNEYPQHMFSWRNKSNINTYDFKMVTCSSGAMHDIQILIMLSLVLLTQIYSAFAKQCRSRSVGFWRSRLIWICTVCHEVCKFVSTTRIKQFDWLKIRNGCGILIYSAWQGLRVNIVWLLFLWDGLYVMLIACLMI